MASTLSMKRVAVIGAGTMGNGIAQVFATAGSQVLLVDSIQPALDKGMAAIDSSLTRMVSKQKITEANAKAALARITPAGVLAGIALPTSWAEPSSPWPR
jgi:3-hydroxybutyryl-CoA dehydrogenase